MTTIFILISNVFSVEFLLNVSDSSLVNLCLVLILGYVISRWKKRAPNLYEKWGYFFAWLLATMVNISQYSEWMGMKISPLVAGTLIKLATVFLSRGVKRVVS